MVTKTLFDNYEGRDVYLYTLDNGKIKAGITDFGGILNFLEVGGVNVLVGYNSIANYVNSRSYCGVTVGRVANRISNSRFMLGGKEYSISSNEGTTCLHGGIKGFDKRFFDAEIKGEKLVLSLVSADGDMGFPGRLEFTAEFELEGKGIKITYTGLSDADTLFSPTCHAYFNLNGGGPVMNTVLKINADCYTPTDDILIPLGHTEKVEGTPLDFRAGKKIGSDYAKLGGKTYDHNFCLNGGEAVKAVADKSGITMRVETNLPGIQLYVGGPSAQNGQGGGYGFCLEPQFWPDAVNCEEFQTPYLKAGVKKSYGVTYKFD